MCTTSTRADRPWVHELLLNANYYTPISHLDFVLEGKEKKLGFDLRPNVSAGRIDEDVRRRRFQERVCYIEAEGKIREGEC